MSDADDLAYIESKKLKIQGLSRYQAREKILDFLEQNGSYKGYGEVSDKDGADSRVKLCKHTGDVLQEVKMANWFFKSREWAKKVNECLLRDDAPEELKIRFSNKEYRDKLIKYLEEIEKSGEDWCISRQSWNGHRMPVFELLGVDNGKMVGKQLMNNIKYLPGGRLDMVEHFVPKHDNLLANWLEHKKLTFEDPAFFRHKFFVAEKRFQKTGDIWFSGVDLDAAKKESYQAVQDGTAGKTGWEQAEDWYSPLDGISMEQEVDVIDSEFTTEWFWGNFTEMTQKCQKNYQKSPKMR